MTRLCLDCQRSVPETHVERGEAGGWWCRWLGLCSFEGRTGLGGSTVHSTIHAEEAAEAKRRGLHVETVGTTGEGGTWWEVRRR